MNVTFKPSQVVLTVPPLAGTMGRSEREHAAAIIVRVCQVKGDVWRAVTWAEAKEVLKSDLDAGIEPMASLLENPFFKPDVGGLTAAGLASRDGDTTELTEAGIAALARWVKSAGDAK